MDKEKVNMSIKLWKEDRTTVAVVKKLLAAFDPHRHVLHASDGTTVDRMKGRAEVIQALIDVERLFEE